MGRFLVLPLIVVGMSAGYASGQEPKFQWKSGQALTYRVHQSTTAVESLKDADPMTTTTQLNLVKRWLVTEVDAQGTATLQMSLVSMRMETKPPRGDAVIFDSAEPANSTAGLREELSKYVGPPLTTVQIDSRGQLVAVKESRFGPASRLQCELPFKLVLPGGAVSPGQAWERTYAIQLDPPHGAGESYDAVQKYACKSIADNRAVVSIATQLKNPPESNSDRVPLLPLMSAGDITFDVARGVLTNVRYEWQQELPQHHGEGSKYVFRNVYSESLVDMK